MELDGRGRRREGAQCGRWSVIAAAQAVVCRETGEYSLFCTEEITLTEHPHIRKMTLERGGVYFEIREAYTRLARGLWDDAFLGGVYSVRLGACLRHEVAGYIVLCARVCRVTVPKTRQLYAPALRLGAG